MAEEKYQVLRDQGQVVARKGLYSQLQFMNKMLKCKAPAKEYFQLSSQQVQYTNDQLFAHVKGVINMNDMTGDNSEEDATTCVLNYTSEQTRGEKFDELKRKIDSRIVNDSHKRAAVASKKYLDTLLADPNVVYWWAKGLIICDAPRQNQAVPADSEMHVKLTNTKNSVGVENEILSDCDS